MSTQEDCCLIIGAGPAGLTAAYELSKLRIPAVIYEQDDIVGGISRTVSYNDYRFDIGGHRFFTKSSAVRDIWQEILGDQFLLRPRLSRIFYEDKFFDYPLKPINALSGLGPIEAVRIGLSYLKARIFPVQDEKNFEEWVSNRFGRRLYEIFFKTYTEKVWGMPCTEIGVEWAAQRIMNLDLLTAVKNALVGAREDGKVVTTLIERFHYPRFGPGMMWERCHDLLAERGYPTHLATRVVGIRYGDGRVRSLLLRDKEGHEWEQSGSHILSSMPIRDLLGAFDPAPPAEIAAAAEQLRYRDFLTVVLILDKRDVFPDNWIYIHSPKVRLGRIQNFKNWSPEMVPDPSRTALGLEYFVQQGDELWNASDPKLLELGRRECAALGLIEESDVIDGTVVRMPKAYPVYDRGYREALATIRGYLAGFPNLQLIGRNGQHRYNNQDHSMLTAMYAARNIAGENYEIWDVNVDDEYHEEIRTEKAVGKDRLVPQPVAMPCERDLIRTAFARYDPVALGGAVSVVAGVGIFLATAVLLIQGGEPLGPTLSLLGSYLWGYNVSWPSAFLGAAEAGTGGFVFGYSLAGLINFVVDRQKRALLSEIEMLQIQE